jgi:phosphatidylinositol alpha-mannosyltransferase
VGTFHACEGVPGYYFGWPVTPVLIRRRARKLGGRIAVSRPALEYARHHIPGEYEIIPNGVDVRHFSPSVTPFEEYRDGKRNLLFVGRLEKRKGLAYLLRAFVRIKREMPDIRLIVVGAGSRLRKRYERFVVQHGLQNDVVFKGVVTYDDLARYFRTADIYCSPATGHESLGVVLLEGLASGTPVIASDIPGYSTVITHDKDGLLFPPKDSARLADALLQLLNDRDLAARLSAAGLQTASGYSWERVGQRVAGFYQSVLAARG